MSDGMNDTVPGYCRDTKRELQKCRQDVVALRRENERLRAMRCKTCYWWDNLEVREGLRQCLRMSLNHTTEGDDIWTGPEFGCVHHKEKGTTKEKP